MSGRVDGVTEVMQESQPVVTAAGCPSKTDAAQEQFIPKQEFVLGVSGVFDFILGHLQWP